MIKDLITIMAGGITVQAFHLSAIVSKPSTIEPFEPLSRRSVYKTANGDVFTLCSDLFKRHTTPDGETLTLVFPFSLSGEFIECRYYELHQCNHENLTT